MKTGLEGRVVLVTGAAGGIGRATVAAFAGEGARLALIDKDEQGLRAVREELEGRTQVTAACADLSSAEGVKEGTRRALEEYRGRCDVLINNVGVCVAHTWDELDDQTWLETFQTNFMSAVRAIRAVLPSMRSAGYGVILNNASVLRASPSPISWTTRSARSALFLSPRRLRSRKGRGSGSTRWPRAHLDPLVDKTRRDGGGAGPHSRDAPQGGR